MSKIGRQVATSGECG